MGWTSANMKNVFTKASRMAMRKIGILLQGESLMRNARIDTGRMQGSITYATYMSKSPTNAPATGADAVSSPADVHTVYIGTNVFYAPYHEYGTKRMTAQPFLRPALHANRKNCQKIYDKEMDKALRAANR